MSVLPVNMVINCQRYRLIKHGPVFFKRPVLAAIQAQLALYSHVTADCTAVKMALNFKLIFLLENDFREIYLLAITSG